MKFLSITLFSLFLNMNIGSAHDGGYHTPNVCTLNQSCAHLKFEEYPTTKKMSSFLIHILPSDKTSIVQILSAKLWMDMGNGHGHGSAPLNIRANEEDNHFDVSNAWFVMPGSWQVMIKFNENGLEQEIIIPLSINE